MDSDRGLEEKLFIAVRGNTAYDRMMTTFSLFCSLFSGNLLLISKFVDINNLKDVLLFYKVFCY